jgi:hypothetical protein
MQTIHSFILSLIQYHRMFKSLKLSGRKGSKGSLDKSTGAQQEQQPRAAASSDVTDSPPKLVPDALAAARLQEADKPGGSRGKGGSSSSSSGSGSGVLRSNSFSGLLVRPKPSKPSFLGSTMTSTAATDPTAAGAAATTPKGTGAARGVGTGPLFLTVKPDCLVVRAPESPQTVRVWACVCECVCASRVTIASEMCS